MIEISAIIIRHLQPESAFTRLDEFLSRESQHIQSFLRFRVKNDIWKLISTSTRHSSRVRKATLLFHSVVLTTFVFISQNRVPVVSKVETVKTLTSFPLWHCCSLLSSTSRSEENFFLINIFHFTSFEKLCRN